MTSTSPTSPTRSASRSASAASSPTSNPEASGSTTGRRRALVVLEGEAAQILPLIEPADAINASGTVESVEGELAVVVTDPAGIALAGDPPATGPAATPRDAPRARPRRSTEASTATCSVGFPALRGVDARGGHRAVSRGHVPPAVADATPSRSPRRGPLAFAGAATVEVDTTGEPWPAPPDGPDPTHARATHG